MIVQQFGIAMLHLLSVSPMCFPYLHMFISCR